MGDETGALSPVSQESPPWLPLPSPERGQLCALALLSGGWQDVSRVASVSLAVQPHDSLESTLSRRSLEVPASDLPVLNPASMACSRDDLHSHSQ